MLTRGPPPIVGSDHVHVVKKVVSELLEVGRLWETTGHPRDGDFVFGAALARHPGRRFPGVPQVQGVFPQLHIREPRWHLVSVTNTSIKEQLRKECTPNTISPV